MQNSAGLLPKLRTRVLRNLRGPAQPRPSPPPTPARPRLPHPAVPLAGLLPSAIAAAFLPACRSPPTVPRTLHHRPLARHPPLLAADASAPLTASPKGPAWANAEARDPSGWCLAPVRTPRHAPSGITASRTPTHPSDCSAACHPPPTAPLRSNHPSSTAPAELQICILISS
jgi:hypothetical protein